MFTENELTQINEIPNENTPEAPKKRSMPKKQTTTTNNCTCGCKHSDEPSFIQAPAVKKSERFDKELEMTMVKGIFHYHEQRGKTLKWYDRYPWKGAKMMRFKAKDQETVELPYYVARRLTEKGEKPVMAEVKDANGRPYQKVTSYVRRFDFYQMSGPMIPAPQRARLTRINRY